jgi:crotonobetainyl-CoA:carnitine CoA-transferase CaiB-like acyl-CoA transferase
MAPAAATRQARPWVATTGTTGRARMAAAMRPAGLGRMAAAVRPVPRAAGTTAAAGARAGRLPLEGVRVFDFTSFWAGPIVGQLLGFFGADVIKVESVQRPDGTRLGTSYGVAGDRPWERAPLFHAVNTGKRGVTLDLTRAEGRDIARRLLQHCDILIENYSARVAEQFGLVEGDLRPDLIVVRMPAFGLSGPWRDLPGFAQTMEQVSGLAWVTGFPDGPPLIPRGPCDPIGGLHAALATLVAVRDRDRTGLGQMVEAPLVESALNVAAEQIVEWSATGHLLQRHGNHGRFAAPHNVYRCLGDDSWVALAVATDRQWQGLRAGLGDPSWASEPELDTVSGRLAAEERIDAELSCWCRRQPADVVVETLWPLGVPVARVVHPRRVIDNPQLWVRGFFEPVEHPVVGSVSLPGFPARLASHPFPLHRSPAPTLGQHNDEVLGGLLGIGPDELTRLAEEGIIGDRPRS